MRTILIGLIVIVTAGIFYVLPASPSVANLETWARDVRMAAATQPQPQSQDIVVVALTDETLDLPQFPYRLPVDRSFMASLIRDLEDKGVRAIGIDILFDRWTEAEKDQDFMAALREEAVGRRGRSKKGARRRGEHHGLDGFVCSFVR